MTGRAFTSARAVAAEVLRQFDPQRAYARLILDRLADQTEERQRATDLVFGTIRNLVAIDRVIERFSGRVATRIDPPLRAVIRIAVYELVYHPETPVYSIVNEAVDGARRTGGKKQTGFVNAVLRSVARHIVARDAAFRESLARRMLVQPPDTGCEFDTDFLPDPRQAAAYFRACFSIPGWLVGEWVAEFGAERTRDICMGCNRRPSVYVRVNTLKTGTDDLMKRFDEAGVRTEAAAASDGEMLRLVGPQAIAQLPGFAEGLFTVQDLSASGAVRLLDPQPGWRILDLCAAPGTKTTQLAERTRGEARVVATDIHAERLVQVRENVSRLECENVTVVPYEEVGRGERGPFDAILVDVPCSNTGVLARRVEARYRVTPDSVRQLARTQLGLLEKATALLGDGGRMCYSTCSIEKAENGDLVRQFLSSGERFDLVGEELTLPAAGAFDHDGAYAAILQRR
jgi:16S rRNA (cytosine967-C5)-methyltransferase